MRRHAATTALRVFGRIVASLRRAAFALLLGATACATSTERLYDGLGQQAGIARVVASLMPLLRADARLGSSFADADMAQLQTRLAEQFCDLSGGPCPYRGKDMRTIHADLNITHAQFNALVEDLQIAMDRNGIAARFQNRLLARLAPMQRDIVTR